jgi:diguanylate cyclase (GGDEF)-like protein
VTKEAAIDGPAFWRGHVIAAGLVAASIAAAALLTVPYGRVMLPSSPGFLPAFGSVTFVCDLLTAMLLFSQARMTRDGQTVRLGVPYLFSSLIIVPHLLAFPGVFAVTPTIGGSASAVWLWCVWHGGFAVGVARYACGRPTQIGPTRIVGSVVAVVVVAACFTVVATAGLPWLPVILQGNQFDRLNTLGIGPAILGITLSAEVLVLMRLRLRSPLAIWLAVALFAASLDVALTLFGDGRYTTSWYVGRGLSLMTGIAVLIALLSELTAQASHVSEMNQQLQQLLGTDVLTKVASRRAFESVLPTEWRRARREASTLSVVMIDVDCFKGFNDLYGHPAGDACLRDVAERLACVLQRPADFIGRIGGEEFVLLLPGTEMAGALRVAELARAAVSRLSITHENSPLGHVTVSLGVASCKPGRVGGVDGQTLIQAADKALYRAKTGGRNQVCAGEIPASTKEAA